MSEKVEFSGEIVRTEPGGFGVVKFDRPVGPNANSYGLVSSSTGTSTVTTIGFAKLRPGVRVTGLAEADDSHQLATIINITIPSE